MGRPHEHLTVEASSRPRRALSLAIGLAVAAWAPRAAALCIPGNVSVMAFTSYSPLGAGVAATATLTYTCIFGQSATVSISAPRAMTSGGNTLAFELYTDPARTRAFPGAPGVPVDGSGTLTIYGFLPAQDAAAGSYSGQLAVTMASDGFGFSRTLRVTASVAGTCSIQPGTLAFGSYDPLSSTPRDATATVSVACTRGTPYTVSLGSGNNAAAGGRRMAGPNGGLLQYELYSDPGRSSVWTAARGGTVTGTAPSTAPIPLSVHGRVPPRQLVPAGDYSDVVQSTITF